MQAAMLSDISSDTSLARLAPTTRLLIALVHAFPRLGKLQVTRLVLGTNTPSKA